MNDILNINQIVWHKDIEPLTLLLDQSPELLNKQMGDKYSPESLLLKAISSNHIDKVKLIIERGADLTNQPENLIGRLIKSTHRDTEPNVEILKLLINQGAKFPDDLNHCSTFISQDLKTVYENDNVEFLQLLIDLGFDPVKTEKTAESSIIMQAMFGRYRTKTTRVADCLLDLGCTLENIGGYRNQQIEVALESYLYEFAEKLLNNGADTKCLQKRLLQNIAENHHDMPVKLLNHLVTDDLDFNVKESDGDTPLHLAAYVNNLNFIAYLVEKGSDINIANNEGYTPLMGAIRQKSKEAISLFISLGADLNLADNKGKTPLDVALSLAGFKRICTAMVKAGAKTQAELSNNTSNQDNQKLIIETAKNSIESGEFWADKFRDYISALNTEQATLWHSLIRHCLDNNSSKPSKKWMKEASSLIDAIGEKTFRDQILKLIPLVKEKRTGKADADNLPEHYYYNEETFISENNTRLLKGLIWITSRYDDAEISRELRMLASQMYKKIYGIGMRNAKLGNASIYSLSVMEGTAGLKEVIILRAATKYNPALVNINRVFDKLAESRGLTPDELAELAIPDYGLSDIGFYTETIGDYTAQLRLTSVGKTELSWLKGEKSQKTVPAALKTDYANEIKEIKAKVKDIQTGSSAHSQRLEQLYLRAHTQDIATWKEQYINHKLIGFLARRLIWRITTPKTKSDVIYTDDGFIDSQNEACELPEKADIVLWHPSMSGVNEVLAWRNWLIENKVTQPFKQAHREIYLLTDAERETKNYSLRFASHILKQHQFHALATQRGWKQNRGGSWDGGQENSAYKTIPAHQINVELVAEGLENYGENNSGIYECVATSQVIFSKSEPIDLENIDPLLFSEVMRDVDLFVGVSSIGNDPDWFDRGISYWDEYSFGQLNASAATRKEVLEALIPKLKIASQLRLEDRFLIVEGKLRTYKIHLGSSNILMEPNNSYLCIVETREKNNIMLPFEGDRILSLIISKAMLLANESKIKDKTILSQINS